MEGKRRGGGGGEGRGRGDGGEEEGEEEEGKGRRRGRGMTSIGIWARHTRLLSWGHLGRTAVRPIAAGAASDVCVGGKHLRSVGHSLYDGF